MADFENDEDLERAIALSLTDVEPANPPPSLADTVDLTPKDENDNDDEDKDELQRALALSLQESGHQIKPLIPPRSNPKASDFCLPKHPHVAALEGDKSAQLQAENSMSSTPKSKTPRPSTLLEMDRKAMEQERLARLGKRKRDASPDRPSKLVAKALQGPAASNEGSNKGSDSSSAGLRYPRGVIKRTWAHKHPRSNDIKIEEVLQATDLKMAVLSAFNWDDRWVFSKLNPNKVKHIWFMNAKGEDLRRKLLGELEEVGIKNLRLHFPPMDGQVFNMHSKLMLLVHEDYLRVVVPTANMIKEDWGETNTDPKGVSWQPAVMENSVFLLDLPRRPDGEAVEEVETAFGKDLVTFLRAQEAPRNIVDGMHKFDFSKTGHLAFVHSIAGSHKDAAADRTGLPGLGNAIRRLKLDDVGILELDYASSSLGALREPFLKQMYLAACGLPHLSEKAPSDLLTHIRIYYPTDKTVKSSTGGPDCGGIITLSRDQYNAPTFPRQCLHDHKSTRPGVLSHNKMLLARGRKTDGSPFAWVYVGSANLTESAWGSQKVLKKSGKAGVLNVRNWECGVVVPVPAEKLRGLQLGEGEVPDMSVFEGTVEVPFKYPGEEYTGKQPWFFQD